MACVAAADPDRQQNTLSVTGVSLSVTRFAMYALNKGKQVIKKSHLSLVAQ